MSKKKIALIIVEILIILITLYFVFGYYNFKRISNNKEPLLMSCTDISTSEEKKVTVCNGVIYKIIRTETFNENVELSLKLWFEQI